MEGEVEPDGLRAALLVAGSKAGELGVVGLARLVEGDGLAIAAQRVLQVLGEVLLPVLANLEEFAGAVAEQLVEADLDLEGRDAVLLEKVVVSLAHEVGLLLRLVAGGDHVAQVHVLEALALADFVV